MSDGRGSHAAPASRAREIVGRVQVLGLASAAAVAERYIETVDRYLEGREPPAGAGVDPADGAGAHALARLEDAAARTLQLLTDGLAAPGRQPDQGSVTTLVLPFVAPGGRSEAVLWVHNPTTVPVAVAVRASSLTSAEGHVLPAAAEVVHPGTGGQVPPGGSCEVRVRVTAPAGTRPGHFHGVVTSTATPRQCLTVLLEVRAPGPEDQG